MVKTFKYINQDILEKYSSEGSCPVCDKKEKLYCFYWDDGQGFCDSSCINCIKTMPLNWICPKEDESSIQNLINKKYPKGTKSGDQRFALVLETADEYRRTPRLPNFIQGEDWPTCCGEFSEFVGDAGRTYEGTLEGFEWYGYENDMCKEQGIEETMTGEDRVSLFQCKECEKKYWTCQYT